MYAICRSYDIYQPLMINNSQSRDEMWSRIEQIIIDIIHSKLGNVSIRGEYDYIYRTDSPIEIKIQLTKESTDKMFVKCSKDLCSFTIFEKIVNKGYVYNSFNYKKICTLKLFRIPPKKRRSIKRKQYPNDEEFMKKFHDVLEDIDKNILID